MSEIKLEEVLAVYNSIHPSRRRWVRNVNALRNEWKELFQILEKASGRSGGKAVVFDPNWHTVADKGSVRGAVNKVVVITETTQEDEDAQKADVIQAADEITAQDVSDAAPAVTTVEVTDQSEATLVPVKKKPAEKRKK